MKKRIGIFGGTFNPIHIGHIKMAEATRKEYRLSCVYFIPCGIPPHRSKKDLLPAKLRYDLVKKAIRGKKYFKALDVEIKKKRKAYTIDTINKLRKNKLSILNPQSSIFFLIGQDEFEKLHRWEKARELAKLVIFLVLPRLKRKIKPPDFGTSGPPDLKWHLVHTKPINISSTEIRKRLKNYL